MCFHLLFKVYKGIGTGRGVRVRVPEGGRVKIEEGRNRVSTYLRELKSKKGKNLGLKDPVG